MTIYGAVVKVFICFEHAACSVIFVRHWSVYRTSYNANAKTCPSYWPRRPTAQSREAYALYTGIASEAQLQV